MSALAATLVVAAAPAFAQDVAMDGRYRQTPDVLARYPELDVALASPAFTGTRDGLTTQTEMEGFLQQLAGSRSRAVLQTLAVSPQGRTLPLVLLTREGLSAADAIVATGRPIVWILAQQHGDEPAGGEAALALVHALATGELSPLLERVVVVVAPRMNPDGAALGQRETAAQMDSNRDHAAMALPETRALHAMIQRLPPDLVIDLHEFSVARRWIEKFGGLQAVDLMVLEATHPMVPDATRRLAREIFAPAIDEVVTRHRLTAFPYHTTTTKRTDKAISMGGNAPGIARNAFGLTGAVSYLLETRGVGIGLDSYQRRVATHYVVAARMLQAAAQQADALRSGVEAARREIASRRHPLVVSHTVKRELIDLPLIDPATGGPRTVSVSMSNSRLIERSSERARPAGYILLADARDALLPLQLFGARTCQIRVTVEVDGEMFELRDRKSVDRRAINPEASVTADLRQVRVVVPAGSIFVPMAQAAGSRIAAALEPDAPGSLVALDIVRVPADANTVPIVRVAAARQLDLIPLDAGAPCGGE